MSVREQLKTSTAAEHRRVDRLFGRFDLARRDGYSRFLLAQASALLPAEAALDAVAADAVPDWPDRRRAGLLKADLADLAVSIPEPFDPVRLSPDKASILGAVYVLEGSRLGGAVLKRVVASGFPQRFLGARQNAGSWRKLLRSLDELLIRPNDVEAAIAAARRLFARFEQAGERYVEAEPSE